MSDGSLIFFVQPARLIIDTKNISSRESIPCNRFVVILLLIIIICDWIYGNRSKSHIEIIELCEVVSGMFTLGGWRGMDWRESLYVVQN